MVNVKITRENRNLLKIGEVPIGKFAIIDSLLFYKISDNFLLNLNLMSLTCRQNWRQDSCCQVLDDKAVEINIKLLVEKTSV